MTPSTNLAMTLKANQRMALLGRLRMAEWMEMPEKEFARQILETESDPLFQKLFFGQPDLPVVIQRQRWPGGRICSNFYEDSSERMESQGERVQVEEKIDEHSRLLPLIRKMGQSNFERYFLYGDENASIEEISKATGLGTKDIIAIHQLILEISLQSEFYRPGQGAAPRSFSCLARLSIQDGDPVFDFFSPHWARGLYRIRYESIEQWKNSLVLSGEERRRLRHLVNRLETLNLRQHTLFRILESLTKLQREYLGTRDEIRLKPISLRNLAKRLDLSPSTVSRAMANRSIQMPWSREAPLSSLVPGQRRVLREVVSHWMEEGSLPSDSKLADRLKKEYGIAISRRTVNAVRNEILKKAENPDSNSARA